MTHKQMRRGEPCYELQIQTETNTPLFVVGTENLTGVVLEQNQEELDADKTQS